MLHHALIRAIAADAGVDDLRLDAGHVEPRLNQSNEGFALRDGRCPSARQTSATRDRVAERVDGQFRLGRIVGGSGRCGWQGYGAYEFRRRRFIACLQCGSRRNTRHNSQSR